MRQGEVIADRFELEKLVGSGGMGEVYRALDRASGEAVAVKALHDRHASAAARFAREAEALAELHHPGIVRYVAHGTAASGEPYLAMEWLSGEDLSSRLRRAPLTVEDAVTLAARAAEALAAVHARGIVHRDLKPSNLFLLDGEVARLKVIDFGIAKVLDATPMTKTGALVGTVGYMAPEQARSEAEIDARADVFSLGCVLFECLTGQQTFTGEHFMAVLAKILLAEALRVRELRPEVPPALDALCARMLAKDPRARPRDGAAVAAALAAVGLAATVLDAAPVPLGPVSSALTHRERRVLSVVLVGPARAWDGSEAPSEWEETQVLSTPEELRREALERGGHLDLLADGSILVTALEIGMATDQAAQAARCALALRDHFKDRPMALATGRAEITGRLPAGEVIDRAAGMLAELTPSVGMHPIVIDEVTAGLLDARFEVLETDAGLWLHGEHAIAAGVRTLLGKPTPCVGRDWELAMLESFWTECEEEPVARAVLVTGPAGMGKSRLIYELTRRIRQREEQATIWIGRGDSLRAGSAFGLLGQVLRGALSLQDGEPLEARRHKLRTRVAERVSASEQQRVAEFLGEIVGTPFPEEESVQLRAARQDAQLMGDQTRWAWVDFLKAETAAHPVLLVLEDLHWGDLPTVRCLDVALCELQRAPWMVLAASRPEVHELFPKLWAGRNVQEIRLKELSPKASARLVRVVLGSGVSAETIDRLVAHADGNAFYLEELIRGATGGTRDALPETVLAMMQSRLEALDREARSVLRAASVFGQTFWHGAAAALLGDRVGGRALGEHLARLERLEWISARPEAKFQGEREFVFRHALVREAAYGMLTEDNRALGHRLAGAWLTQIGEPSAVVIAEHFDRGGATAHAVDFYQRAAAQALAGSDLGAVLLLTERAVALGASGVPFGELGLIRAEALNWRGEFAEALRWAREALDALPKGGARWYDASSEAMIAASRLGQHDRLGALASEFAGAWTPEEVTGPAVVAAARTAPLLFLMGLQGQAEEIHAKIEVVAARFAGDPAVSGAVFEARSIRAYTAGHIGGSHDLRKVAIACFERAGDIRYACSARINLGSVQCMLGSYAEAAALLRLALTDSERIGLENIVGDALQNLGLALWHLGAFEEARAVEMRAITLFATQGDQRMEGASHTYLAGILRSAGLLDEAETEARRAVALLSVAKPLQILARGTLADVLLARGEHAEALVEAREAMALLASLGKAEEGEALARLVYAEALEATGDPAAACIAIAEARDRLLAQEARIVDPNRRKTFLENVPENARTLSLARRWLGEPAATP